MFAVDVDCYRYERENKKFVKYTTIDINPDAIAYMSYHHMRHAEIYFKNSNLSSIIVTHAHADKIVDMANVQLVRLIEE